MTKKELQKNFFETTNELQLKVELIKYIEEYGFNKTSALFIFKNKLLLASCNIDENLFNQILFKNYIYHLNSENNLIYETYKDDTEILIKFNTALKKNDFKEAFEIYENSSIIYQILCLLYINNIKNSDFTKLNKLKDKNIENVYNKLLILHNINLTSKKDNIKIKQKVSTK